MTNEGINFDNSFSSLNLCTPSRFASATGILPNRKGIYRNIDAEARGFDPGKRVNLKDSYPEKVLELKAIREKEAF